MVSLNHPEFCDETFKYFTYFLYEGRKLGDLLFAFLEHWDPPEISVRDQILSCA